MVLNLSECLSLMGACSRLEHLLVVVPLGTSRAGDDSPPRGEGGRILLALSYRWTIHCNIKRGNTHSESGILEAGGGCLGEKSSLGLHHQTLPSPLLVSPHQMNQL